MLPATVRLRRRVEFDVVVRHGQRSGHGPLAVHVHPGMPRTAVGFIVSRAVGNSVVRHRVTRQLRHLMRDRYRALPSGTGVVVRALPGIAGQSSSELDRSLDRALNRALDRTPSRPGPVPGPVPGLVPGPITGPIKGAVKAADHGDESAALTAEGSP